MKNLHLLPTENPSRLVLDSINNNLFLTTTKSFPSDIMKFKNIYITSDEKPKQGEWSLYQNKIHKCIEDIIGDEFKKIILTTDQDLIKDGVQAIDDEFLEWFVKNPSCEEVGIHELRFFNPDTNESGHCKWELYIPKEEPKQFEDEFEFQSRIINNVWDKEEPNQEMRKVCKCKRAYENPLSEICSLCWNELYPNKKDEIKDEDLLEPKQETLEELAKEFYSDENQLMERIAFKRGYTECKENSYSEEEVLQLLLRLQQTEYYDNLYDWFKQFKKK